MRITDDAVIRATDGAVGWTEELYAGVDATDAAAFAGAFAEDGVLRWANEPPVSGSERIKAFVGGFSSRSRRSNTPSPGFGGLRAPSREQTG